MQFELNGRPVDYHGDTAKPLLWVLRETVGATGTKFGCGKKICGACTVHVDGAAMTSCDLAVAEIAGKSVTTIEGLSAGHALHPVQQAWLDLDVGQCGYCQPGVIMAVAALKARDTAPTVQEMEAAIGNLCRCATYKRMRDAIASIARDEPTVSAPENARRALPAADPDEAYVELGDWIRIGSTGTIRIGVSQSEMGQGSTTGLPMLVAEEMDCDWRAVRVDIVTGREAYRVDLLGYHGQFVGGSLSTTFMFDRLRQAGAQARRALVAAAAQVWNVAPAACSAKNSQVIHAASGRQLGYAELAVAAQAVLSDLPAPMKARSAYGLVGTTQPRVDAEAHVRGTSIFGMDVDVPGMLVGAIRYAGGFGAKVKSVDDSAALAMPGVVQVVPLEDAVIVLATGYWEAEAAADALAIEVDATAGLGLSTDSVFAANRAALEQAEAVVAVDRGDVAAMLAAALARRHHRMEYSVPYIAHGTIEPVVATVHIESNKATIWAPTQGQDVIRDRLFNIFQVPEAAVTVHTTYIGGGFGRKFVPDFVIQAAFASKACGRPVKLIRSRAEDLRHDFYRPGLVARFEATLDAEGYPLAMRARIAGQSLLYQMFPMWVVNGVDEATVEGTSDQPYQIPNLQVEMVDVPQIIPMGFLRSVGRSANVFFVESFIDDLAGLAGIDRVAYRRRLLGDDARAIAVLDAATGHAGGRTLASDRFRGFAYAPYIGRGGHYTTRVAAVVEIRKHEDGALSVEHVTVAIDPGIAINPAIVRAQVEGCVGFALTSVMKSQITMTDGLVDQASFDDFRLLTLAEMPDVEVLILEGDAASPGGVGEATMPVIGPALAAAMQAATGERPTSMPFDSHARFRARHGKP